MKNFSEQHFMLIFLFDFLFWDVRLIPEYFTQLKLSKWETSDPGENILTSRGKFYFLRNGLTGATQFVMGKALLPLLLK